MKNESGITLNLFGEDADFEGRQHFRQLVQTELERLALGKHLGGGSMVTDEEPNYNVEFVVSDESRALALIRDILRAAGVGPATELTVNADRRDRVYDDVWTDLGPRPPSPVVEAETGPSRSGEGAKVDMLQLLRQIAEEGRRMYPPRKGRPEVQ